MKSATKSTKPTPTKSGLISARVARPKSNLTAGIGKYKDAIVEKDACWDEDLKRTIID